MEEISFVKARTTSVLTPIYIHNYLIESTHGVLVKLTDSMNKSLPAGLYKAGRHCMWRPVFGLGVADAPSRPVSSELSLYRRALSICTERRIVAVTSVYMLI